VDIQFLICSLLLCMCDQPVAEPTCRLVSVCKIMWVCPLVNERTCRLVSVCMWVCPLVNERTCRLVSVCMSQTRNTRAVDSEMMCWSRSLQQMSTMVNRWPSSLPAQQSTYLLYFYIKCVYTILGHPGVIQLATTASGITLGIRGCVYTSY